MQPAGHLGADVAIAMWLITPGSGLAAITVWQPSDAADHAFFL